MYISIPGLLVGKRIDTSSKDPQTKYYKLFILQSHGSDEDEIPSFSVSEEVFSKVEKSKNYIFEGLYVTGGNYGNYIKITGFKPA